MDAGKIAISFIKPVLFVTVALCVVGAAMLGSFPVSILPDVTFPRIVIIAQSGERPMRTMEAGVARPLEEAIATVPGVTKIRTQIQRGAAETSVDFRWGEDMLTAQQLVGARIEEARAQFPPETTIHSERMNPTVFPILGLSVHGSGLSQSELWSIATYQIKPVLSRVPGVARVVVQGGAVPEIQVNADPAKLAAFHLSMTDVEQALTGSNVVRSVGLVDRRFQQYQALVSGENTDPSQLGGIVIAQRAGTPIYLRNVAAVTPGVQDPTTIVTAEGVPSVLLNVVRQPDANTVACADAVQQEIAHLQPTLPAGVKVGLFYNQAVLVREAIGSVRDAVLIGAILAVVVLMLFLGNLRATLVTAVIIPATLLITFLFMRLTGLTLNLMTLGALAVGIGLIIDDAIVVVENVFRHLAAGTGREEAIKAASREIAAPMISSTLTTVVVFLPLILLSGVAGAFFTALALTLAIALMVSLGLALFVSPSLCAAFLKVKPGAHEHGKLFEKFVNLYESVLRYCFRHGWILPAAAAAAIGGTLFFGSRLQSGFMPEMDEGAFILDYLTPPGTSLAESDRLLKGIDQVLDHTPEVASYSRRTGTELGFAITEPNRGDYAVVLKQGSRRRIDDVIADVRAKVTDAVPGVDIDFSQVLQDLIGDLAGAPAPVQVKLFGENQEQLNAAGDTVKAALDKVKGVADTKSSAIEAGPEIIATIDQAAAGRVGLSPDAIGAQVNAALYGDIVTQLLQNGRQIAVRARVDKRFLNSEISSLLVHTPAGSDVPLGSLAHIERVAGTNEMNREDQRRVVSISGQLDNRDLGSVAKDVVAAMSHITLPPGVTYALGGQFQSQKESFNNLIIVLGLAILLVFGVMLFQFGSFTAPLVILLVMPLSLLGVTMGLFITKTPLNVSSFMGAIMLAGIVVKNGILLLDRAQQAERDGALPEEAATRAGRTRLRPILMTTLTALLGLVPLALGIGAGAEMQKPLAIAVIGGLSLSTVFTLLMAPLLYAYFRRFLTRYSSRSQQIAPETV